MKKPIVAICYDFDKTLATNDMQSFSFIPKLGMSEEEFWSKCDIFAKENGTDSTLSYLRVMMDECKKKDIKLTRDYLRSLGKNIQFFEGVSTWFKRINAYAKERNIKLEHYIISSGNKEIIEGSSIINEFKEVYGCEYLYDENGIAYWPKTIVNYTLKTQYLFRICKGTIDLTDEEKVNQRINKKRIEFRNIIYMGDGITDVPAMTLVKEKGGTAISIYKPGEKHKARKLSEDDRVNYASESNFRANSNLERYVHLILNSISLKTQMLSKEEKNRSTIEK